MNCAPTPRSWFNKLRESLLALGLEMKHSKVWILERYLNTVYYGQRSYGVAAAAKTYFGKSLDELTAEEVNFLVTRPKSPNKPSPLAGEGVRPRRTGEGGAARHFLEYASRFLSDDAPVIQTTLDLSLQTKLEAATARLLADRALDDPLLNAAVVVIDVKTGDLLALVGSRDYFNDGIAGQVNAAQALRQPGSTLKPFTYFAAFAKGFAPDSIVPDEPFSFQAVGVEESDGYAPQNFDRRYHGAMTIRQALANSYNIPAVVTLNEIGLSYYHDLLRKFGFTSLNRPPPHYGLSVTLGSGEVSLLELTNAYATLARGGIYRPYCFIGERTLSVGRVMRGKVSDGGEGRRQNLSEAAGPDRLTAASAFQYAAQVTSILSDPEARLKAFGFNGDMTVEGHEVAVKTGTSFEHRDNWTVGYTPSFAIGVWVGHSDGSPMPLGENGLPATGASGAAPLWHAAMETVLRGRPAERFPKPFPSHPPVNRTTIVKQDKKPWKVISPVPNTTYRLSRFVPEEHQRIAGVADVALNQTASLSWYLDDVYLNGTQGTGKNAPVWMRPIPGKHTLRVVSSTGEKQEIRFRVLDSESENSL